MLGYTDGSIRIVNPKQLDCEPFYIPGLYGMKIKDFNLNNGRIYFYQSDTLKLISLEIPDFTWAQQITRENVQSLIYCEKLHRIIIVSKQKYITILDTEKLTDAECSSEKILWEKEFQGEIYAAVNFKQEEMIIVVDLNAREKDYILVNLADNEIIMTQRIIFNNDEWTTTVSFLGATDFVVTGEINGELGFNHKLNLIHMVYIFPHRTAVSAMACSTEGDRVIIGYSDGVFIISYMEYEGTVIKHIRDEHLPVQYSSITSIKLSLDESILITSSADGYIRIWDFYMKYTTNALKFPKVKSLYIANDNSKILASSNDGVLAMWSINEGSFLGQMENCFDFTLDSSEETMWLVRSEQIQFITNPMMNAFSFSIKKAVGSNMTFRRYIKLIATGAKLNYEPGYNHRILTLYNYGILHFYAYYNLSDYFTKALNDGAIFIRGINNVTPLTICIQKGKRKLVELIIEHLMEQAESNRSIAHFFDYTTLCFINRALPQIAETVFNKFFVQIRELELPRECESSADLPKILAISGLHSVDSEKFLGEETNISENKTEVIEFKQFLLPICLENGSREMIAFIESLVECTNAEIFTTQIVKYIVDYMWKSARTFAYWQTAFFLLYLVLLLVYSLYYRENLLVLGLLTVVSTFHSAYEIYYLWLDSKSYLQDKWNYVDQARSLLMYLYLLVFFAFDSDSTEEFLLLLLSIFSWAKGITYFNSYSKTRYMIFLIEEVINDIGPFLVLIAYGIIAFGTMFTMLDDTNRGLYDNLNLTYQLGLGNFDTQGYSVLQTILFLMSSAFIMILMLNLLISIMGDTFDKVQDSKVVADNVKRLETILEYQRCMKRGANNTCDELQYVTVCLKIEKDNAELNVWEGKISQIKNIVKRSKNSLSQKINHLEKKSSEDYKHLSQKIEHLEIAIGKITSILEEKFK